MKNNAASSLETPFDKGLGLFTDLYELTMLQAYFEQAMEAEAVFSLFVRRLPRRRNFLLACGLETLLAQLEQLRFEPEELEYLASLGKFRDPFLEWLADLRFRGEVHAVAEGTPIFANEPILEVVASLPEAQLIETLVMNQIHLQTVLASKAVRLVEAAGGRPVVDFGARRMHGLDAAVKAGRAFHIAGIASTSNLLAGRYYGVPVSGTMAHSYIQAYASEALALEDFARLYPGTILLVDTYDSLEGIGRVIELVGRLGDEVKISAVRLDSGDLDHLSKTGRRMLDEAGLEDIEIFASGGLDEDKIHELLAGGAPIDGIGVGSSMGVADDAPVLDIAYKLAAYAGEGRLKLSSGKPILPGRKQVFRQAQDGFYTGDVIGCATEDHPGQALLSRVMENGRRVAARTTELDALRKGCREQLERLPAHIRQIGPADPPYPVETSAALERHQQSVARKMQSANR